MGTVDHLVYAVPDLGAGCAAFERGTGIAPAAGGAHPGIGTHNALVSFGSSYLELIAPDPGQPDPSGPRPFGVDDLIEPGLAGFAVRPGPGESLDELIARLVAAGHDPGPALPMSRRRPDGVELSWRLTMPVPRGATPFLIDWGDAPMPCDTAPGGVALDSLTMFDPDPERAGSILAALGVDAAVESAPHPGLEAQVRGPSDRVTLPPATFRPEV